MFSVPVILAFVVGVLASLSIVNSFVKRKKYKKQEKIDNTAKNCEKHIYNKSKRSCWCSEYDLSKEQIAEIFEKYGVQLCGKDASSIIEDNNISPSIAEKLNVHKSTIRAN